MRSTPCELDPAQIGPHEDLGGLPGLRLGESAGSEQRGRITLEVAGAKPHTPAILLGHVCPRSGVGKKRSSHDPDQDLRARRVLLGEREMRGPVDDHQLGRLPRLLVETDRLFGRRDDVIGGVKQQQGARRDVRDHVLGAKFVHADRSLDRHLEQRLGREILAQRLGDRHHVETRYPHALSGFRLVASAALQEVGEPRPGFGGRMLAAELALAISPSAGRDHTGNSLVDSGGVDRDGGTEAVADHSDPLGIDLVAPCDEGERALGVGDLVEATNLPPLSPALAAAAHIDPERAVAEALEHARLELRMGLVLRSGETMQDDECRQPLAVTPLARDMEHP